MAVGRRKPQTGTCPGSAGGPSSLRLLCRARPRDALQAAQCGSGWIPGPKLRAAFPGRFPIWVRFSRPTPEGVRQGCLCSLHVGRRFREAGSLTQGRTASQAHPVPQPPPGKPSLRARGWEAVRDPRVGARESPCRGFRNGSDRIRPTARSQPCRGRAVWPVPWFPHGENRHESSTDQ